MDKILDELKSIGIEEEPEKTEDGYVINIEDEDQWGRYFSCLDDSDFRTDTDEDELDLFHSKYNFYSKSYTYTLTSNFDKDEYSLIITERN